MVSDIRLFVEPEFQEKAQHYSAVLSDRGVQVNLSVVEKINARFELVVFVSVCRRSPYGATTD